MTMRVKWSEPEVMALFVAHYVARVQPSEHACSFPCASHLARRFSIWVTHCSGLSENGPHRLIYLNTWSPVGRSVGKG